MIPKQYRAIFALIALTCSLPILAAHWKAFFYMDSSDNLSDMAIKNITDIVRGNPNNKIDFLIQLHAYHEVALRYRVSNKNLIFLEEVPLTGNSKQDFIDASRWAFSSHNADYTMLIFSNHGWGILDPQWNPETQKWKTQDNTLCNSCVVKRPHAIMYDKQHEKHKGFMFNTQAHTYLTNHDLVDGLDFITKNLLKNNKLDIIAFDTCMGCMLEVGHQLAPYAHYLVGSQICSLPDGFNYQSIVTVLNQGLTPPQAAKGMVHAFDAYYTQHDTSGIYTHAALDLSHIDKVTKALNTVVTQLIAMPELTSLTIKARNESPRFCMWPMYTDLIAFCKNIDKQLATLPPSAKTAALQKALQKCYKTTQNLVLARCAGHETKNKTHGVAIYLPSNMIDDSYYKSTFAHTSQWVNLLKAISLNS